MRSGTAEGGALPPFPRGITPRSGVLGVKTPHHTPLLSFRFSYSYQSENLYMPANYMPSLSLYDVFGLTSCSFITICLNLFSNN